jgi:hypothetical protein
MQQIDTTTVKRTTAKSRRYIYPYIPLPLQYALLVGSQVERWQNRDNEITLRFRQSEPCHAQLRGGSSLLQFFQDFICLSNPPHPFEYEVDRGMMLLIRSGGHRVLGENLLEAVLIGKSRSALNTNVG